MITASCFFSIFLLLVIKYAVVSEEAGDVVLDVIDPDLIVCKTSVEAPQGALW